MQKLQPTTLPITSIAAYSFWMVGHETAKAQLFTALHADSNTFEMSFSDVPGAINISLRCTLHFESVTDNTTKEKESERERHHHTPHSYSHHVPSLHRRPICRWRKLNQYLFLQLC